MNQWSDARHRVLQIASVQPSSTAFKREKKLKEKAKKICWPKITLLFMFPVSLQQMNLLSIAYSRQTVVLLSE